MSSSDVADGRLFTRAEYGVDACERMASLSFTTVARVAGELPTPRLRDALSALEQKHVLLRAAVDRSGARLRFLQGRAAPIPVREIQAPPERVLTEAEAALQQRDWTDAGPRGELLIIRHADDDCSLLLTLHHLVSDGSSGIMLMRDLLAGAAAVARAEHPCVDSPGLNVYQPAVHRGPGAWMRAAGVALRSLLRAAPLRLRQAQWRTDLSRQIELRALRLDVPSTRALCAQAKADGVTVHGVIAATMSQAVLACAQRPGLIRIMHAVNMRKQLPPEQRSDTLDQACGYYVSGLETDHRPHAGQTTAALATEIHGALHAGLKRGEPWVVIPLLIPALTALVPRRGDVRRWAAFYERLAFRPSFGITNLGRLETLQVRTQLGALQVKEFYFCAAGSVMYELGLSVTHLDDRLTVVLNSQRARLSSAQMQVLSETLMQGLLAYAARSPGGSCLSAAAAR